MDLPIIELVGSAKSMGEAFGESCGEEARELYALRMASAIRSSERNGRTVTEEQVLAIARECLKPTRAYDSLVYEEFVGIANAAGLSPEQCYVLQGLTDLHDLLAFGPLPEGMGCSSFILGADRSATGEMLLGQNWDLYTDNMPYVRLVHRKPENDPETWSLTLTGCLSLIGINAEGIAIGNTNLQTTDARVGVQYLTVLHRALRSRSLSEAVESICQAPRSGAHYYYAAGPDGVAVGLECSATRAVPFEIRKGSFVHCNHALSEEIAVLEAQAATPSTLYRQERLAQLLESHNRPIGIDDLKRFLSDHEGGEDRCICRHDFEDVSTNATVILSPGTCEIHACRSQPHVGRWVTRSAKA
jgi:isopenicillin-N N-acyltransferase-like protein